MKPLPTGPAVPYTPPLGADGVASQFWKSLLLSRLLTLPEIPLAVLP